MTLAQTPSARIQLCGPTVIEWNGNRIEGRLPGRQGRALVAYLIINRHRLVSRPELTEALWPSQAPAASEAAMNALISKLRKVLGEGTLEGRSSIRLRLRADARIDTEVAEDAVHRAESKIALKDCTHAWGPALAALFVSEREFLPGEDAPWIDEKRNHLAEIRLRSLEAYAAAALAIGGTELPGAVRAARQLVRDAPLRETGYQLLMQANVDQGNVAEALRVYTNLCNTLRDELGISPSQPTQAVYSGIIQV